MKSRPILFSGATQVEWRPVVGLEGRYQVSSDGKIRSPRRDLMLTWRNPKGYHYVTFRSANGKRVAKGVHRAVLEAFAGPCPRGHEAAHGDGDPSNNRLDNLRWATSVDNHADRRRHGRIPTGEDNHATKLDQSMVITIKKLRGIASSYELAHLACVHPSTIQAIWNGETWKTA